jgi:hypothetical protein
MADAIYNSFKKKSMDGSIDLDSDTIKVMLVTSSYTPGQGAHGFRDDVTNEAFGTFTSPAAKRQKAKVADNTQCVFPSQPRLATHNFDGCRGKTRVTSHRGARSRAVVESFAASYRSASAVMISAQLPMLPGPLPVKASMNSCQVPFGFWPLKTRSGQVDVIDDVRYALQEEP